MGRSRPRVTSEKGSKCWGKSRVRLGKETVTEQETVDDEVRKERVDLDGDVPQSDRR
jgi:hypothetical protein